MAPRRSVRNLNVSNPTNYTNLKLNDVMCPICRSILIEPVSLPCNHGFCSSCFEGTVANTNLVCPLCRVRIGSWLRTSKKDNKLVNVNLWNTIQKEFPKQVKNKLEGVEEYHEDLTPPRIITLPGEIRREYEAEKMKNEIELQKEREVEEKASETLIKQLQAEEDYAQVVREENMRLSEQVAKKLSQEYCFDPGPSSSGVTMKKQGPIDKLLQNLSNKKVTVTLQPSQAPAKEFVCKNLCQNKTIQDVSKFLDKTSLLNKKIQDKLKKVINEREAADSNDSIDSECRFFKPIEPKLVPLPKKVPVIKVPAVTRTVSTVIIGPPKGEANFKHSSLESAFVLVKVIKRPTSTTKMSKCDTIITDLPPSDEKTTELNHNLPSKRKRVKSPEICVKKNRMSSGSPSFRGFDNVNGITTKTNGIITHYSNISNVRNDLKKRQEEDDFQLAVKLQDELNRRYYNTRNNFTVQIKKPLARQVTLKEIISQSVSNIP